MLNKAKKEKNGFVKFIKNDNLYFMMNNSKMEYDMDILDISTKMATMSIKNTKMTNS